MPSERRRIHSQVTYCTGEVSLPWMHSLGQLCSLCPCLLPAQILALAPRALPGQLLGHGCGCSSGTLSSVPFPSSPITALCSQQQGRALSQTCVSSVYNLLLIKATGCRDLVKRAPFPFSSVRHTYVQKKKALLCQANKTHFNVVGFFNLYFLSVPEHLPRFALSPQGVEVPFQFFCIST